MRKAKALVTLILGILIFVFAFAVMFSGNDPEFIVALFILLLGFVQVFEFTYGQIGHQKYLFTLPYTCLCVIGVLFFGIWTFVFSDSLNEIRVATLMSLVSLFILIGVSLEAFDQEF